MKKNLKKLLLNKSTLSNLENQNVIGGINAETILPYCKELRFKNKTDDTCRDCALLTNEASCAPRQ